MARKRPTILLVSVLITMLIAWLVPQQAIEQYFSRMWFIAIRQLLDFFAQIVPFPLIYLLIGGLLGRLVFIWRSPKPEQSSTQKWMDVGLGVLTWLGWAFVLFQWLWGFNYFRVPFEQQIGLETPENMEFDAKKALKEQLTITLAARKAISDAPTDTSFLELPKTYEVDSLRHILRKRLATWQFPAIGHVQIAHLPKGTLQRIGTAGFYLPYTGEGHLDGGLHPLQIPFVAAHEMTHGYGMGDEGVCNFVAYIVCKDTKDPFLNYVAELQLLRYLMADVAYYYEDEWPTIRADFPRLIQYDLRSIRDYMDRYPEWFPWLRNATYEAYLQAQGIEEGMASYSKLTQMVYLYREKLKSLEKENKNKRAPQNNAFKWN